MTIQGMKVARRKSELRDFRDPEVVRRIREEADIAVRHARTRRRLRRWRAAAHLI